MKSSHTYVRISADLMGRVAPVADTLGISQNRFAELALSAVIELVEAESAERRIPRIVRMVDAARHIDRNPQGFADPQPAVKEATETPKKRRP